LTNPGFDGSLTGWAVVGGALYQPSADAEDCADSGSILLENLGHEIKQCLSAEPDTLYSFGFRFLGTGPGDLPSAFCAMIFYKGTGCTTASDTSNITSVQPVSDKTSWVQGSGSGRSPEDTGSVILICSGSAGFGYYDQLFLSSTNATF
jgi:hypothetical protein